MADLLEVIGEGVEVFDLGRPMFTGMPQSPNHPAFRMILARRHGDKVRADGGSAASEILITGGHVGTHIDALSHVSQEGKLHGGHDAAEAQTGGSFSIHGINEVEPMVCRGILLDVASALGRDALEGGDEISVRDLELTAEKQKTSPQKGDVVLIRTGWGKNWDDPVAYFGEKTGVPGVGEAGAEWLAAAGVRAAGSDTIAFERLAPGAGHSLLPVHRIMLVENGVHIIETLYLDELAERQVHEFLFVLAPLKLVGATGSPVRPLAISNK